MARSTHRGFTLIELLVVVAIIGVIVAIAIPNLINAIQRGRQKRTMGDMRVVAHAVEAYDCDWGFGPRGVATVRGLDPYITPTYLRRLPYRDGWNNLLLWQSNGHRLRSLGAGHETDASAAEGPTTDFEDDIIMANGVFIRWPEGMQVD